MCLTDLGKLMASVDLDVCIPDINGSFSKAFDIDSSQNLKKKKKKKKKKKQQQQLTSMSNMKTNIQTSLYSSHTKKDQNRTS